MTMDCTTACNGRKVPADGARAEGPQPHFGRLERVQRPICALVCLRREPVTADRDHRDKPQPWYESERPTQCSRKPLTPSCPRLSSLRIPPLLALLQNGRRRSLHSTVSWKWKTCRFGCGMTTEHSWRTMRLAAWTCLSATLSSSTQRTVQSRSGTSSQGKALAMERSCLGSTSIPCQHGSCQPSRKQRKAPALAKANQHRQVRRLLRRTQQAQATIAPRTMTSTVMNPRHQQQHRQQHRHRH